MGGRITPMTFDQEFSRLGTQNDKSLHAIGRIFAQGISETLEQSVDLAASVACRSQDDYHEHHELRLNS